MAGANLLTISEDENEQALLLPLYKGEIDSQDRMVTASASRKPSLINSCDSTITSDFSSLQPTGFFVACSQ